MSVLEKAVRSWREELARHPEISAADRDELEDHLRHLIDERLALGLPLPEAIASAQLQLGDCSELATAWRAAPEERASGAPRRRGGDRSGFRWRAIGPSLYQDFSYAVRLLARKPAFTAVIVLVLAIGIGANTAIFSLVQNLVWQPPNLEDPEQLVVFASVDTEGRVGDGLSFPDFRVYSEEQTVIQGMALHFPWSVRMRVDEQNSMVWGNITSANYFEALGVEPRLGRTYAPEQLDEPGAPVVLLSHSLWQRQLGADPRVVGRRVHLNGTAFTVIGVTPAGFRGAHALISAEFWLPIEAAELILPAARDMLEDRKQRNMWAIGRLRPGTSLDQAQHRFSAMAQVLEQEYPEANRGVGIRVLPESSARMGMNSGSVLRLASIVMLVSVALVLVIACVNVANLVLAQSAGRRQELGVRLALGASRRRLLRQLLTESVCLALLGGLLGIVLSFSLLRLLAAATASGLGFPIHFEPSLDPQVLLYALTITVVTGVLCGLAPSLQGTRDSATGGLRGSERGSIPSGGRLRRGLVVAQVAACLVLLMVASLFARSFQKVVDIDVGFEPEDRLTVAVDLGQYGYDQTRSRQFYRDLRADVEQLPGVRSASWAMPMPLDTFAVSAFVYLDGYERTDQRDEPLRVLFSSIDDAYFGTLGAPILRGRGVAATDSAERSRVAVVNETMAKRYWPNSDPIGRTFRLDDPDGPTLEVVGIAADGKYRQVAEAPVPYLFLPYEQGSTPPTRASLLVHAHTEPGQLAEQIRGAARALDEEVLLLDFRSLDQHLSRSAFMPARAAAALVSLFGLLGLSLAILGLYGLISYSVSQQTREIGLRMAMGATRAKIVRMVLTFALKLIAKGVAVGILLALGAGQLVVGLLYNTSAIDLVTFLVVPPLLALVALLACLLPSLRATRIDPMRALHSD